MPQRKSKRATTYRQHPNALSALDIHTMMSYQCFQALCAISLVRSRCMLMLSILIDDDNNDDDFFSHLPSSPLTFMQQSLLRYTWFRVHEHWTWSSHPLVWPSQPQPNIWSNRRWVVLPPHTLHRSPASWALSSSPASGYVHHFYCWSQGFFRRSFHHNRYKIGHW